NSQIHRSIMDRRILMLRSLSGELSNEEEELLRRMLAGNPEARAEMERMELTSGVLKRSGKAAFVDGFADRVMQRLQGERQHRGFIPSAEFLAPLFYRLAGVALTLLLIVGIHNVVTNTSTFQQSPVEALFGLPQVNVERAYSGLLGYDLSDGR